MNFSSRAREHLANYKRDRLRVVQSGYFRDKPYEHILPSELTDLNLTESYRKEILDYIEQSRINRHKGFGHLNSSQAMALNFFFPFVCENRLDLLAEVVGADTSDVLMWAFEHVIDHKENTNFDFFLELGSGQRVFFEIKYTESFGAAANDARHQDKYSQIYEPSLKSKVKQQFLTSEYVFSNYQILRNLSYLDISKGDRVLFIYPKGNKHAADRLERVLKEAVEDEYKHHVVSIPWETAVERAENVLLSDKNQTAIADLLAELRLFKEKYLFS